MFSCYWWLRYPIFPAKYLYLLLPFSCLIALARTFCTVLNSIAGWRDILTFVHLSVTVSVFYKWSRLFYLYFFLDVVYEAEKCLSVSSLLRIFMMNGVLDFIRWFSPFICWSDLVVIFLRQLILWIMITDFLFNFWKFILLKDSWLTFEC